MATAVRRATWRVRKGEQADAQALQVLLAGEQMEADVRAEEFWVAEMDGQVVGAVRPEHEGPDVYLRPVVVAPDRQGLGIGRALVLCVAQGLPALRVVARGEAVGFYRRLGFVVMPWEHVPLRYRWECQSCPDYETCRPVPMILQRRHV